MSSVNPTVADAIRIRNYAMLARTQKKKQELALEALEVSIASLQEATRCIADFNSAYGADNILTLTQDLKGITANLSDTLAMLSE